jgi:hypothetical protein
MLNQHGNYRAEKLGLKAQKHAMFDEILPTLFPEKFLLKWKQTRAEDALRTEFKVSYFFVFVYIDYNDTLTNSLFL